MDYEVRKIEANRYGESIWECCFREHVSGGANSKKVAALMIGVPSQVLEGYCPNRLWIIACVLMLPSKSIIACPSSPALRLKNSISIGVHSRKLARSLGVRCGAFQLFLPPYPPLRFVLVQWFSSYLEGFLL